MQILDGRLALQPHHGVSIQCAAFFCFTLTTCKYNWAQARACVHMRDHAPIFLTSSLLATALPGSRVYLRDPRRECRVYHMSVLLCTCLSL